MAENRLAGYEDQQSQWDTAPESAQAQHDLNVGWGHTIANPTTGNTSDRWIPVKGFNSWNEAWRPYVQNFGGEDYLPTSSYMALNPKINKGDFLSTYGVPLIGALMTAGIASGAAAGAGAGAGAAVPAAEAGTVAAGTSGAAQAFSGAPAMFGAETLVPSIAGGTAPSAIAGATEFLTPSLAAEFGSFGAVPSAFSAPSAGGVEAAAPDGSQPSSFTTGGTNNAFGPNPVDAAPSSAPGGSPTGTPVGTGTAGSPGAPAGAGGVQGVPSAPSASTVKAATDVSKIDPISVQKVLKTLGIYDPVKGALGTNALPAAGLALSAVNNARSGKGLEKDLAAAGAQSKAVADRLLAQNGPTAATAYEIDQWLQNTTGAIAQRYSSMGRDPMNDSAAAREISDAKAKAVAMRDAAAQGMLQQGLQAAQIAQGPATQAAMAAAQKDQAFWQSVASMLQSMAMIEAMKNSTTVPTTPAPTVTP